MDSRPPAGVSRSPHSYQQAGTIPGPPGQGASLAPQQASGTPNRAQQQPQRTPSGPGQQQQEGSTGGTSPPRGLRNFFPRKPADGDTTSGTSPQQSPERRRGFGSFGRSNPANRQQQQEQQPQEQQQQAAAVPADQGSPGQGPAAQHQARHGAAPVQPVAGVAPVVPPASGLCSKAPPGLEEVTALQGRQLTSSKFGLLNRPASGSTSTSTTSLPRAPTSQRNSAGGVSYVDPNYPYGPPLEPRFGPFLRFTGYEPATQIYSASVMMVVHQSVSPAAPQLKYRDAHSRGGEMTVRALTPPLWSYAGYNFWRWDLQMQLSASPAVIEYWAVMSTDNVFSAGHTRHHFHLPAVGQSWHWGFYSCNGFHDHAEEVRMGGIQPLWRDVMQMHARDPLHVMFGGGDQLYCDDVWEVPSMKEWLKIQDKNSRNAHPFTQQMVNETYDFYFRNYTHHFSKEVFRDGLASIPQVMIWDDHDIFDGWGSYPPALQSCPVFQGVFYVARRFFLLFQCHADITNYRELNRGWGLTGLSTLHMLGSTTAVVSLDTRGERTLQQIIRPASWAAFAHQVSQLPGTVRHVVVVATVPLIYPTVPLSEGLFSNMARWGPGGMAILQKTGLAAKLLNVFGEPMLLDDLLDHWSADIHAKEKLCFVQLMQDLARARGFRFTLVSGDVHCAGAACFQTFPKVNLRTDHRYILQVISSAIGNQPPPAGVLKALSVSGKMKRTKMLDDKVTREKIMAVFEDNGILKGARNWCDVHERPLLHVPSAAAAAMTGGTADGSLHFQLRVEHPQYGGTNPDTYDLYAPLLELPPGMFVKGPLREAPPLPGLMGELYRNELTFKGVGLQDALPVHHVQAQATAQMMTQAQVTVTQGQVPGQAQVGVQSQTVTQAHGQAQVQTGGTPQVQPQAAGGTPGAPASYPMVPALASQPVPPPTGSFSHSAGGSAAPPPAAAAVAQQHFSFSYGGAPQQQQYQQTPSYSGAVPQQQYQQSTSYGAVPQQQPSSPYGGAPQQQPSSSYGGAPQQQPSSSYGGAPQQQPYSPYGGAPQQQPSYGSAPAPPPYGYGAATAPPPVAQPGPSYAQQPLYPAAPVAHQGYQPPPYPGTQAAAPQYQMYPGAPPATPYPAAGGPYPQAGANYSAGGPYLQTPGAYPQAGGPYPPAATVAPGPGGYQHSPYPAGAPPPPYGGYPGYGA